MGTVAPGIMYSLVGTTSSQYDNAAYITNVPLPNSTNTLIVCG